LNWYDAKLSSSAQRALTGNVMEEKEKIRILLIEDNPDDAMLVEMLLKTDRGIFDVELADTLAKGLKRIKEGQIDVILLDLMLPDSVGFTTFSKMQSEATSIPIIIMASLNNESMATRAIRKGAQDYFVKSQIGRNNLERAIMYAVVRHAGEGRKITVEQLKGFDGQEGRRAYIAYKGKVFDVSDSKLWKNGLHGALHSPGKDLTEEFKSAPHGEEVLSRVTSVGEFIKEEYFAQRFLTVLERLHPHSITVHFAIAYSIAVSAFSLLYLFSGNSSFERASFYMLVGGFLAVMVAGISGVLSWKIAYEGKMTPIFRRKIIFTVILAIVVTAALMLRVVNPVILVEETVLKYAYLTMLLILTPIVIVLGHAGGKIVHP